MAENVLVVGGAGFIGSRLSAALSEDCRVTVFDNFHPQAHDGNPDNRARLERLRLPVIEGDVRDPAALRRAVKRAAPSVVYHLAAETGTGQSFDLPARYSDVNVMGTAHLIEAIRAEGASVRRVVLAGSRSVYGEGACVDEAGRPVAAVERTAEDMAAGDFRPKDAQGNPLTPVATNADCPVAPASIYASTKLMQEYLLRQGFWGTDVSVGLLRLQNVYGPGQSTNNPYTGVLSIFARQVQEGKILEIYEDGEITRDFVHVEDVVRAFVAMGRVAEVPEAVVDIGSGEAATILRVAREMLQLFGRSPDELRISGKFRAGDIRHAVADISAAKQALGWTPQVGLSEGLRSLAEWSRTVVAA